MPTLGGRLLRWRTALAVVMGLVLLLPQCVSVRMSDRAIRNYFAEKALKPAFDYVTYGPHRLHYARLALADTLPMVLFIHGSPGSWDAFIGFFADSTLYRRTQLVAVDRPGFGKSALGEPEPSLQAQAALIAPLLRLGRSGRKPILVGHSLGGPVAARLAMDYPDRVGGLVLVAPSIDPALEKNEWYRWLGATWLGRKWLPTEFDVSNQEILPLKGELAKMLPLWTRIQGPVTVIQGTDDELVPPGNADFARRMLVHAPTHFVMVPQMNHFIPWRRPDLIRTAILTHLSAHQ